MDEREPQKKALIVGISDYGGRLPRLDSPEREIEEWRDLLMEEYGFRAPDIRLLANERARKQEIESRLQWLLTDARPGDQLVFIYAGHGVRLPKRAGSGEILDGLDEAMLAHPSSPTDDLDALAIYDDELFDLYLKCDVPDDARVTFIFDCCHGGGFNSGDLPRRPKVMSVALPVDLRHRTLYAPKPLRSRPKMPLILNAAGELNLSIELDLDGTRRSLFSYFALKTLRATPDITYHHLVDVIKPTIEEYFPQLPNLRGNLSRSHNRFLH
jgi:hypothetical protein